MELESLTKGSICLAGINPVIPASKNAKPNTSKKATSIGASSPRRRSAGPGRQSIKRRMAEKRAVPEEGGKRITLRRAKGAAKEEERRIESRVKKRKPKL
jgi:hypothetical protein